MNPSLRSCLVFSVAAICFAAFAYADATQDVTINRTAVYSVKLTVAVGGPNSSQLLLVTTVYSKDPNSTALAAPSPFSDSRLRYAYTSQRIWPCSGPTKTMSSGATPTHEEIGIVAPGRYKVTVHVTSVNPPLLPSGHVPLPAVIGDAALTNPAGPMEYELRPPSGNPGDVHFSFNPASGTHAAPVTVFATATVVPAASGMRYIFELSCDVCQPAKATQDGASSSYTYITKAASPPSRNFFQAWVNKVRQSDCAWLGTTITRNEYVVVP